MAAIPNPLKRKASLLFDSGERPPRPALDTLYQMDRVRQPTPAATEQQRQGPSPYSSEIVYIYFGASRARYPMSKGILESQAPGLPIEKNSWGAWEANLPHIHEDAGHTLVHFIFTGVYQSWPSSRLWVVPADHKRQYRQSVLVFRAASTYGLDPLKRIARSQMQLHGNRLCIFDTLDVLRAHFETLSMDEDNPFVFDEIAARLERAFSADEHVFRDDRFSELLGGNIPEFDQYVARLAFQSLTGRIHELRELNTRLQAVQRVTTTPSSTESVQEGTPGEQRAFSPVLKSSFATSGLPSLYRWQNPACTPEDWTLSIR